MNKLRAIIVEDEPSGLENLRWKLNQNCPEVEIVEECTNGQDAIRAIHRHLPDILFLDIMLGDMTGFDVVAAIKHPSFELIFTTSYDEYGIKAIKNQALDYLLKPIDVDELVEAVSKVKIKMMQQTPQAVPATPTPTRLGFPIATGQQFIEVDKVVFAEASDNVAVLHLNDKSEVKLTKSLGWTEDQLKAHGFCRLHHSFLVNLNHMREYIRNDGGYVVMSNGKAISISRRRKDEFLKSLEQWNISM